MLEDRRITMSHVRDVFAADRTHYILFVRPAWDLAISYWKQYVQMGGALRLEDFVNGEVVGPSGKRSRLGDFSQMSMIDSARSIFQRNVVIANYSMLKNQEALLAWFEDRLGLQFSAEKIASLSKNSRKSNNVSVKDEYIELLRKANLRLKTPFNPSRRIDLRAKWLRRFGVDIRSFFQSKATQLLIPDRRSQDSIAIVRRQLESEFQKDWSKALMEVD